MANWYIRLIAFAIVAVLLGYSIYIGLDYRLAAVLFVLFVLVVVFKDRLIALAKWVLRQEEKASWEANVLPPQELKDRLWKEIDAVGSYLKARGYQLDLYYFEPKDKGAYILSKDGILDSLGFCSTFDSKILKRTPPHFFERHQRLANAENVGEISSKYFIEKEKVPMEFLSKLEEILKKTERG